MKWEYLPIYVSEDNITNQFCKQELKSVVLKQKNKWCIIYMYAVTEILQSIFHVQQIQYKMLKN